VIVVDNASGDETVEMIRNEFPHVEVIANSTNRGFGGANNQGAALADSDWILYLNSDCYASPGAVKRLAEALNAAGAVGGGGKLLNMDGSLQQSVAGELTLGAVAREQFLIEKLTTSYWQTPTVAQAVTQVMGACLMVRRDLNLQFDESFFLYCEDTDLCQRIRQHGEIWYIPEAEFTHELGTSSKRNPWLGIARYNATCTPGYLNSEGGGDMRSARAIAWMTSVLGFAEYVENWRQQGDLPGLVLTPNS
jgi:GT2 family glycosyltransferase